MGEADTSLPMLFIAGAPKSGTSSVFRWLDDHPQAHGSLPKETCFFADPGTHVFRPDFNSALDLDLYKSAFQNPSEKTRIMFEGTASYLYSRTALDQIPDLPGGPKCLFILREPAAQILSTYSYFRNNWGAIPSDMGFEDYLRALRAGKHDFGGNELVSNALDNARYAPWLLDWKARLGVDRMKVCTFDMLRQDPGKFMSDLALWVGIDPAFYDDYAFQPENESYVPVNRSLQRLNIALRARLPKGRIYQTARHLYRHLNTRAPDKNIDQGVLAQLRAEFTDVNRDLAEAFGLDLTVWET